MRIDQPTVARVGAFLLAIAIAAGAIACSGGEGTKAPSGTPTPPATCYEENAPASCPITIAAPTRLVQQSRTNDGFLFYSYFYQFKTTGLDYDSMTAATWIVSPFLPGLPDGVMRHRVRDNHLVDMQFPPYAEPGHYTLTLKLADGRTFSVDFDHTP